MQAVKIEYLPQGDVERANAATDGRGQRAFDADAKFQKRVDGFLRKPVVELGFGFFSGENLVPDDAAFSGVGFFDGGVEHAD